MRSPRLLAVVLVAVVAALAACAPSQPPSVSEQTLQAIEADTSWTWTPQDGDLDLGVTHTQYSLDPDEPEDARQRGTDILSNNGAIWQNIHLMGFGTGNPEPASGEYDWSTLDERMQLVKDTGGRTVLTACCAPDWMKGGTPGETDWNQLETAPDPAHFGDYANLVAAAVERYPQIERVLVWNELKGFYSSDKNRWDYEGYTDLYNQVYRAVKAVRPDVEVGGPYVVMTSLDPSSHDASATVKGAWGAADQRPLDVIDYWLQHNVGADFIAVDGATSIRDVDHVTSVVQGAQKFADLTAWIRQRTDLPVWWAEFYPDVPAGETGGPDSQASAVATLATIAAYAQSGVSVALLWSPQADDTLAYAALWTDSTQPDGGQPTPLTAAWQWLVPRLAAGDVEIGHSTRLPLLVFRASDGAVVVNPTGDDVQVTPDTEPVPGWAVTVTNRGS